MRVVGLILLSLLFTFPAFGTQAHGAPSFAEWMETARADNPGVSDEALAQYWNDKYGRLNQTTLLRMLDIDQQQAKDETHDAELLLLALTGKVTTPEWRTTFAASARSERQRFIQQLIALLQEKVETKSPLRPL
jgi:hypothetical protein